MEPPVANFSEFSKENLLRDSLKKSVISPDGTAEEISPFIRELAEGKYETIDFEVPLAEKPLWLDEEKFKRGQKFASNHLFGVIYSEMLSLLMLFALKPILGALISTGQSSTPYRAFRRYFGTAQKIVSWYEEDVWRRGPARTNMAIVRGLHKSVFNKLQEMEEKETPDITTLGNSEEIALWSTSKDTLLLDFKEFCSSHPAYAYLGSTAKVIWVSQLDMAMTQFGFVGLAVTYPKHFGIYNTTDEELDDFVYMWRALGYLLGIKDPYNFCNGDLPTIRQRSKDIIDEVVKPALREIDAEWEHMSRCLVGGVSLYTCRQSFESCILYLCYVLQINIPRFKKCVSYKNSFNFYLRRFFFFLARIPFISDYFNRCFKKEMKNIEKIPPEIYAKWEATEFPYMHQPGRTFSTLS